jgi:hypothetical protein
MRNFFHSAIALLVLAPFIFVLESFVHGAPQTVTRNGETVRVSCREGGGSVRFCICVAEGFKARLDVNAIAWRRVMFVRDTIPNKQQHHEEAHAACRAQLK